MHQPQINSLATKVNQVAAPKVSISEPSYITGVSIVCSFVCSGADKKHQGSASMTILREFHWWPVDSPYKGPVTRKIFPFDDGMMLNHTLPKTRSPVTIVSGSQSLWILHRSINSYCPGFTCVTYAATVFNLAKITLTREIAGVLSILFPWWYPSISYVTFQVTRYLQELVHFIDKKQGAQVSEDVAQIINGQKKC